MDCLNKQIDEKQNRPVKYGAVILLNGVQYGRKSIQNRKNDQARI